MPVSVYVLYAGLLRVRVITSDDAPLSIFQVAFLQQLNAAHLEADDRQLCSHRQRSDRGVGVQDRGACWKRIRSKRKRKMLGQTVRM